MGSCSLRFWVVLTLCQLLGAVSVEGFQIQSSSNHYHHNGGRTRPAISNDEISRIRLWSTTPVAVIPGDEEVIQGYERFPLMPPENEEAKYDLGELSNADKDDSLRGLMIQDIREFGGSRVSIDSLPEPFALVADDIRPFMDSMRELLSSDQPLLNRFAQDFLGEKQTDPFLRPTIVQLVAEAVQPVDHVKDDDVWRKTAQLGQVVEMIHVAHAIHDDIANDPDEQSSSSKKQQQKKQKQFAGLSPDKMMMMQKLYSNKVAVLAGDFLLSRASVLLARLENTQVVQLIATALDCLVTAEIMKLEMLQASTFDVERCLKRGYYKTSALVGYACHSAALLGGQKSGVARTCEEFGFHLGLAREIQEGIPKPLSPQPLLRETFTGNDVEPTSVLAGIAVRELPQLKTLANRSFQNRGDRKKLSQAVVAATAANNNNNSKSKISGGTDVIDLAQALSRFHAQKAINALLRLPESDARNSLVRVTLSSVVPSS